MKRNPTHFFFMLFFTSFGSVLAENVFKDQVYLRENDVYSLDFSRLKSLEYSSLDFESNNKEIKLPGVTTGNKSLHYEEI